MPIKNLPQGRLTFFPTCDSLDVTNDTHIIMTYNNLPMRMLDMCHNLVHKPVRVCTYAHTHSRLDLRNPHCTSSRVKHNAYMPALHSRDAHDYDYTARRDRNHRRDRLHMTYRSRDNTP